jgi:hypothetical protein
VVPEPFYILNMIRMVNTASRYTWNALDNSKIISFQEDNGSYKIGPVGGKQVELLASITKENSYNLTDDPMIYDSIENAITESGRSGTYKSFVLSSKYFKASIIKSITLTLEYSPEPRANFKKITKLAIGKYKNGIYNVVTHANITDENYYDNSNNLDENELFYPTFIIDENLGSLIVDKEMLEDDLSGIFICALETKDDKNDLLVKQFAPSTSFTDKSIFNDCPWLRIICCHKGTSDNISSCIPGSGSQSAPTYIPFFSYNCSIEEIVDHISSNFSKYHISTEDTAQMNSLKFTTPHIENIKKTNISNIVFKQIYLSHETLMGNNANLSTRPSRFNLTNKTISQISIPLNQKKQWQSAEASNYFNLDFYRKKTSNEILKYIPMRLRISMQEPDSENFVKWHISSNANTQVTPVNPINRNDNQDIQIDYLFNFDNVKYEGKGIWIEVVNAISDFGSYSDDAKLISDFGMSIFESAVSNNEDYIISRILKKSDSVIEETTKTYNLVAPISVYFDFNTRSSWFDTIDEHILQSKLIEYGTYNPYDETNSSTDHHISSFTLAGDYVPRIIDGNKKFYLNAITWNPGGKPANAEGHNVNNGPCWLKIQDGNNNYISTNSVTLLNGSFNVPTWIFDLNDRIIFQNDTIRVGLVSTPDKEAEFDSLATNDTSTQRRSTVFM